jgi:hypothetical protein
MRWKLLVVVTCAVFVIPLALFIPGCYGPDNPKIADAPPPSAPKPDEVKPHMTKVGGKSVEYGDHPKYKKSMDRLNK